MGSSILERTRGNGGLPVRESEPRGASQPRFGKSVLIVLLFILVGCGISVGVSMLAGSSPYGVLIAAVAVAAAVPLLALIIQAAPEAMANARLLFRNWTWWHPLWFFIFFSMLVFRIRDVSDAKANPLDAFAMLRILPEAFVALTLIIRLILKKPNWLGALFRGIPGAMAVYCLVCVATTPFSVKPDWTAYKSLEFLADVSLLASIVASAEGFFTYKNLVDWTLTFYGLSLIGVWSNLPLWPTEAMDGGRLTGVIPVEASNSVGTSGAVLAIVALCRLSPVFGRAKDKAWYMLLLVFGLVSMVLSKTRNAEAAFAFAVVVIVIASPRWRKIAAWGSLAVAPLIAMAAILNDRLLPQAWDLVISIAQRDQSDAALGSLSGRTAWWEYGIQQLMHHPWTGLGAYAAGRFAVLGKLGVGSAAMMHSDWIEVLIGTSIWGLIPFAGALIAAWWYLIRCIRSDVFTDDQRQLGLELFALLGMLTMHSFFNDELSWHCPLLYFAILGYAEFVRTYPKVQPGLALGRRPLWSERIDASNTATTAFHQN
ncbi:MAG TPA: O-antigen ligase family protein [Candidatus Dormibacteraeota bacterium]|nr:O-antigen ligase family protein [Candidatus Dormibacteraeota bacterium]